MSIGLPTADAAFLDERAITHQLLLDGGVISVILPAWPLPPGYDRASADLLLLLMPGYPDVAPDMWWFDPPLRRLDGIQIPGTELSETHLGRCWQRWSRHFTPGQWRSGTDGLHSFLALIGAELRRNTGIAA
jgi:hypothetical protein